MTTFEDLQNTNEEPEHPPELRPWSAWEQRWPGIPHIEDVALLRKDDRYELVHYKAARFPTWREAQAHFYANHRVVATAHSARYWCCLCEKEEGLT